MAARRIRNSPIAMIRHELVCEKCGERPLPEAVAARKTAVMTRLQEQRRAREGVR
jgi:hypothetical protein